MGKYYVYLYLTEQEGSLLCYGKKLDIHKNQVFYIGKGCEKRAFSKARNKDTNLFIKLFGCQVVIFKDRLTEQEALHMETNLISILRDEGFALTNKQYNQRLNVKEVSSLDILKNYENRFNEIILK